MSGRWINRATVLVGWKGRSQASQGEGHCHQKGCVAVEVAPYGPSPGLPCTRA